MAPHPPLLILRNFIIIFREDKKPILDLNLRLGEGSGAAVASLIIKSSLAIHNGMATFSEAGMSRKK